MHSMLFWIDGGVAWHSMSTVGTWVTGHSHGPCWTKTKNTSSANY